MNMSIYQFLESSCELAKHQTFPYLFRTTNGDPCTTGCAFFDGGKCEAYKTIQAQERARKQCFTKPTETVREKAQRLGISISKARKPFNS